MGIRLTQENFLIKARVLHGDKYSYPIFEKFPNNRTYIDISCRLHGNFRQTISAHLTGRGCPLCANKNRNDKTKLGNEGFIKRAKEKHGEKYDYSKISYKNNTTKIEIICPEHGSFWQSPMVHMEVDNCCPVCHQKSRMCLETFIKKSKDLYGNRFSYDNTVYYSMRNNINITCNRHGDFITNAANHLSGLKGGCKQCMSEFLRNSKVLSQQDFIDRSIQIHSNEYDYSMSVYQDTHEKISILCRKHGMFSMLPSRHWNGYGCPKCYGSSSIPQREIENFIIELGFHIDINDRSILTHPIDKRKNLELDIVIKEKKLAIEYCGLYWHNDTNIPDINYHKNKYKQTLVNGYKLLTIFGDEWKNNNGIVKSIIRHKLEINNKSIGARLTTIAIIDQSTARKFLIENHIQGKINGRHYGLIYKEQLIAIMTVGKPRYNKSYDLEILRFCTKLDISIPGGMSKLFRYILTLYRPNNVLSYADLRYGTGDSYGKLGFVKIKESSPNYFYIPNDKYKRESRQKYQKHKLVKKGYDSNLTEIEIMKSMGFNRIWDCGHAVWVWQTKD